VFFFSGLDSVYVWIAEYSIRNPERNDTGVFHE